MTMDIKIMHDAKVVNSLAVPLLVEGWAALIQDGVVDNGVLIAWDHGVFYAVDLSWNKQVVGVLSYLKTEWNNCFTVALGYVKPNYRQSGIYNAMWKSLVHKAREDRIAYIYGMTSIKNQTMLEVYEHQGREQQVITTRYGVKW